jgi:ferrous iron transport protein A
MSAVLSLDVCSPPQARQVLSDLAKGQSARVLCVAASGADVPVDLTRRLSELGFLPGERVQVLARGPLGGEPVAVRVGTSTFALRRLEADCIEIAPLE